MDSTLSVQFYVCVCVCYFILGKWERKSEQKTENGEKQITRLSTDLMKERWNGKIMLRNHFYQFKSFILFFLLFFRECVCLRAFVQWVEVWQAAGVDDVWISVYFILFFLSLDFDSFDAGGINFQVICRFQMCYQSYNIDIWLKLKPSIRNVGESFRRMCRIESNGK